MPRGETRTLIGMGRADRGMSVRSRKEGRSAARLRQALYVRRMRNASALASGLVLIAVAVYAFVAGHEAGAVVVGGVAVVTLALPVLRRHFRPSLGLRQHLWISIVFFLVVAFGFTLIALSTDSDVRALPWLVAVCFFGMAIAGVAMDWRLRKKEHP